MLASQYEELLLSLKSENSHFKSQRDLLLAEQQQLRAKVEELESYNDSIKKQLVAMKNLYNDKSRQLQESQLVYEYKCVEYERQIKGALERVSILEMRNKSLEGMLNTIFQDAQESKGGLF